MCGEGPGCSEDRLHPSVLRGGRRLVVADPLIEETDEGDETQDEHTHLVVPAGLLQGEER